MSLHLVFLSSALMAACVPDLQPRFCLFIMLRWLFWLVETFLGLQFTPLSLAAPAAGPGGGGVTGVLWRSMATAEGLVLPGLGPRGW